MITALATAQQRRHEPQPWMLPTSIFISPRNFQLHNHPLNQLDNHPFNLHLNQLVNQVASPVINQIQTSVRRQAHSPLPILAYNLQDNLVINLLATRLIRVHCNLVYNPVCSALSNNPHRDHQFSLALYRVRSPPHSQVCNQAEDQHSYHRHSLRVSQVQRQVRSQVDSRLDSHQWFPVVCLKKRRE
jgi:hypothetical protein